MLRSMLTNALRGGGSTTGRRGGGLGSSGGLGKTTQGGHGGGRGDVGGQVGAQVGRSLLGRLTRRR